jgi:hypothetical protein
VGGAFFHSTMSVLPTKEDPSPTFKLDVPSRFKTRRLAIFGALTAAAAFLLLAPTSRLSLNRSLSDYAPVCVDTSPIPATAPHHNVWKNFDVEEAAAIREWLWAYTDSDGRGFNFTSGLAATDVWVVIIEVLLSLLNDSRIEITGFRS